MVMSVDHFWLAAVKQQEPATLPSGTVGAIPLDLSQQWHQRRETAYRFVFDHEDEDEEYERG